MSIEEWGLVLKQKDRAIVVTNPMIAANKSSEVTLGKFLRVIAGAHKSIKVIGGNLHLPDDLMHVELCNHAIQRAPSKARRMLNILTLQCKMALSVLKYATPNHRIFFWIGDKMILPYLAAKLKRSEVNYFIYGNVAKEGNSGRLVKLSVQLVQWMAKHADYTCAESPGVFDEWPNLKVCRKRIIHLYTECVEMAELSERQNIIGMLCRVAPGKHVIESIKAFETFHKSNSEWSMEIVGSGVQEAECNRLIEELSATEYIKMYGWIDHDKLQSITCRWKYLLFPTDTEGLPNSVIELMGKGIPAIASPVGGVKDIVIHEHNGWIIDEPTVNSIMTTLENAVSAPAYSHIALHACQSITNTFSLDAAKRSVCRTLNN